MKKIIGQIITAFFVFTLGIIWIFTTKHYVMPTNFEITITDKNNNKIIGNELRTEFSTKEVAYSFMEEYQKLYPFYNFSLDIICIKLKKRWTVKVLN